MAHTKIFETSDRNIIDLRSYMRQNNHPVLCMGPMSKNSVEAVIRLANRLKKPIPLIASRRQVDCEEFGGGYVNNWNTRTFAEYVHSRDYGYVPLCRDHGGPWQGASENDLPDDLAMQRARISMLEDITAGFDVIHIDPSLRGGALTDQVTLDKIFDLYTFVCDTARQLGRRVEIEVGAEQQNGHFSDPKELVTFLKAMTTFCEKNSLQRPLFCVVQTGTLVKEMKNVGLTDGRKNQAYDQKYAVESMEKAIRYLSDIAYINGVYIKEHNGDYLSDGSMSFRRKLNIGGINVAPEIGVFESKIIVSLCLELGLNKLLDETLQIFYDSKKWDKWMCEESDASDMDKAIISGHYSFSNPKFIEIKNQIAHAAKRKERIDLDEHITVQLMTCLKRMIWSMGYFGGLGKQISSEESTPLVKSDITINTHLDV
jgi:hypothetical protein